MDMPIKQQEGYLSKVTALWYLSWSACPIRTSSCGPTLSDMSMCPFLYNCHVITMADLYSTFPTRFHAHRAN